MSKFVVYRSPMAGWCVTLGARSSREARVASFGQDEARARALADALNIIMAQDAAQAPERKAREAALAAAMSGPMPGDAGAQ